MSTPEKAKEIRGAVAAAIGFLTALWGWVGWVVILWVLFVLMDYITGSMAARKEHNWSSDIAREGLWHKAGEIFAVLLAALCDIALRIIIEDSGVQIPFEVGPLLTPVVLLWYMLTEAGSIIENCGRLGAPVPVWFKQKIDHAVEAIDKDQEQQIGPVNYEEEAQKKLTEFKAMFKQERPFESSVIS